MNQVTLIRDLMQSKFICAVSDEDGFNWLQDSRNYHQMNENLRPYGAKLTSFGDGEVYAALNTEVSDADKNKVVKEFGVIHTDIRNLVEIITTLAVADENGNTLYNGMILKQDSLVVAANNNKDFEVRLQKASRITSSESKPNDEKIASLLARLQKDELVKLMNSDRKIFKVTGKIAYVMSIIEFINDNYLPIEESYDSASQREFDL